MGKFATNKLSIVDSKEGNYSFQTIGDIQIDVEANGQWRNRPRGKRLFTDDEIRAIRISQASQRHLAKVYDCSHVLIYYIVKRAIYSDVIDAPIRRRR